ncbi:phage major capsid protein [Bradyrhizobium sp. 4]|uniref:phage major capsid protein n=1 Tax=unclassified Bradyrhizobium TaxID=2631580 RepID=UPI001FFA6785|nr:MULTISPECIES: phage major capsid protein [unclassified Bradyrhizobium]MCK1401970.1 phage major capsid protein [Bradyrhizobium sp. 39]MCK1751310.1 phage major capsid protein [Bradyrhizobium sp. 135]UPJ38559.1 phage major capsid protein [Bradyrhizobium sp. 4]
MKRYLPLMALAAIVLIAAVAVVGFDYSAVAHAHSFGGVVADAAGGAAATEELVRQFKAHSADVLSKLEAAGGETKGLSQRMTEIEQKMTLLRQGGGSADVADSWGAQVIRSEVFKSLDGQRWKGRARFNVKTTATLTSANGGSAGDSGALAPPDRQAQPIGLARRRLRMRDVFAPGRTDKGTIEWPRQTARSNNAATVAEGALKPQSDMSFDLVNWPVKTIAHWLLASRQILDDAPALMSFIDSDLLYDLAYIEENQLLSGSGAGSDVLGVLANATSYSPPFVPASAGNITKIDVLLLAIAQVQAMDFEPDFIAVNPLDWTDILVTKNDVGDYVGSGPMAAQAELLWQLPVVTTKAMTVDNFLVGPGKRGAQIFDRQEAAVEVSTEDSDNFRRNLVTVLAEERLAFVLKYPAAFVKGTFTAALAA